MMAASSARPNCWDEPMARTREIKNRMKAIANIERITRTMQMVATAKFQTAVRRATQTKPYTEKVMELAGELSSAGGEVDHPLLRAPAEPVGRELLLVITSNRGLCGAYNANILRTAMQHLRNTEREVELEVAGKKGISYFRFSGQPVQAAYTQFEDRPAYADVDEIASRCIDRFINRELDAVRVASMQFVSNAKQVPQLRTLLPLEKPGSDGSEGGGSSVVYEFSPTPALLLEELLPVTVKTQLFQCFNDAGVSEQIARMVAMKAASDNASEMGRNLRRQFNRARQAQITTELNEIISGAAALE